MAVKIVLGRFGPRLPSRQERDVTTGLVDEDAEDEGDGIARSVWLVGVVGTDDDPDWASCKKKCSEI